MLETPGLADVIAGAIDSRLVDVHTALAGVVEAYDATRKTADVRPAIKRVLRDEEDVRIIEQLPVIPSVPVAFLSAGPFVFKFPIPVGSTGLLLFAEASLDQWRATGLDGDPGDTRRHSLSGAIFIPGLRPRDAAIEDSNPDDLVIGRDGGFLAAVTPADEIELPQGSTNKIARADRTEALIDAIAQALDAFAAAVPTPTDGGAAIQAAFKAVWGTGAPPTPPADVGCDQVRGT